MRITCIMWLSNPLVSALHTCEEASIIIKSKNHTYSYNNYNIINTYIALMLYHFRYSSVTPTFYQTDLAMRNTADVAGSKPTFNDYRNKLN
jgi:hypothetical protein